MGCGVSAISTEAEIRQRRSRKVYRQVSESYDALNPRRQLLKEGRTKILRYKPGDWIDVARGVSTRDFHVPSATTLLLIGPRGSGKSTLVNTISQFFENEGFTARRAQVSNNAVGEGTLFLQEYMIPAVSGSFCLYDTRALSDDVLESMGMLRNWLTSGVRHGELVIRDSDGTSLDILQSKARESGHPSGRVRPVNFVIMVVNAVAVLESMKSHDEGRQYTNLISSIFQWRFLSFKDDKPAVVITHGDLLPLVDRVQVRIDLGRLLGIPPDQVFDISENNEPGTNLAIIDLLSHSLQRADRNLR